MGSLNMQPSSEQPQKKFKFNIFHFWREQDQLLTKLNSIQSRSFFSSTRHRQDEACKRLKKLNSKCQILDFFAVLNAEISACHFFFDRHFLYELVQFKNYMWEKILSPMKLPYDASGLVRLVKTAEDGRSPSNQRDAQVKLADCYIKILNSVSDDSCEISTESPLQSLTKHTRRLIRGLLSKIFGTNNSRFSNNDNYGRDVIDRCVIGVYMSPPIAREHLAVIAARYMASSTEDSNLVQRARCAVLYARSRGHYAQVISAVLEIFKAQQFVIKFKLSSQDEHEETLDVIQLMHQALFEEDERVKGQLIPRASVFNRDVVVGSSVFSSDLLIDVLLRDEKACSLINTLRTDTTLPGSELVRDMFEHMNNRRNAAVLNRSVRSSNSASSSTVQRNQQLLATNNSSTSADISSQFTLVTV